MSPYESECAGSGEVCILSSSMLLISGVSMGCWLSSVLNSISL